MKTPFALRLTYSEVEGDLLKLSQNKFEKCEDFIEQRRMLTLLRIFTANFSLSFTNFPVDFYSISHH